MRLRCLFNWCSNGQHKKNLSMRNNMPDALIKRMAEGDRSDFNKEYNGNSINSINIDLVNIHKFMLARGRELYKYIIKGNVIMIKRYYWAFGNGWLDTYSKKAVRLVPYLISNESLTDLLCIIDIKDFESEDLEIALLFKNDSAINRLAEFVKVEKIGMITKWIIVKMLHSRISLVKPFWVNRVPDEVYQIEQKRKEIIEIDDVDKRMNIYRKWLRELFDIASDWLLGAKYFALMNKLDMKLLADIPMIQELGDYCCYSSHEAYNESMPVSQCGLDLCLYDNRFYAVKRLLSRGVKPSKDVVYAVYLKGALCDTDIKVLMAVD